MVLGLCRNGSAFDADLPTMVHLLLPPHDRSKTGMHNVCHTVASRDTVLAKPDHRVAFRKFHSVCEWAVGVRFYTRGARCRRKSGRRAAVQGRRRAVGRRSAWIFIGLGATADDALRQRRIQGVARRKRSGRRGDSGAFRGEMGVNTQGLSNALLQHVARGLRNVSNALERDGTCRFDTCCTNVVLGVQCASHPPT